jgi:hypothetical protein
VAGIIGASVSKSMVSGDTAVNGAQSGYVRNERILLSTSPSGSSYTWAIAAPTSSAVASSALSSTTSATPSFIPDVAGAYLITCEVDGTEYTLRLTVENVAYAQLVDLLRLTPVADASVPTPSLGANVYFSSDHDLFVLKDTNGDVFPIELGAAL